MPGDEWEKGTPVPNPFQKKGDPFLSMAKVRGHPGPRLVID